MFYESFHLRKKNENKNSALRTNQSESKKRSHLTGFSKIHKNLGEEKINRIPTGRKADSLNQTNFVGGFWGNKPTYLLLK
jgi:hypothetical protein